MASTIQIILNQGNFVTGREKGGGGNRKDFFENNDAGFARHKANIIYQLGEIAENLDGRATGKTGTVKIVLRRAAWAKSHRPFKSLFKPNLTPVVGGGDLGEIFVEVNSGSLHRIRDAVRTAEVKTRMKYDNKGNYKPYPSTVRRETGAIERIEIYGPADRRRFPVKEAVAWLMSPMSGGAYHIELFDVPPPPDQWDNIEERKRILYETFVDGIRNFGQGIVSEALTLNFRVQGRISLRLEKSSSPPKLFFEEETRPRRSSREVFPFDADIERHKALLIFLDDHPLVRRVELPPKIRRATDLFDESPYSQFAVGREPPTNFTISAPENEFSYPSLGIIDGGISHIFDSWITDRWDILDDAHKNLEHGTFIAGLVVNGRRLNSEAICPEPDGVNIVDISILPEDPAFLDYFPNGGADFLDEISTAVSQTSDETRIYNISLCSDNPVDPVWYSYAAERLDEIAEENDVIFFISAGNTDEHDARPEWASDEVRVLSDLATGRNDGILQPAESVRNVSVAALNPPDLPESIPYAPARYSRRGPGLRVGVKPDIAHVGGGGTPLPPLGHGLFSVYPHGEVYSSLGTSFATPLAAKTAAVLDNSIVGHVTRETIIALLLHHSRTPQPLISKNLRRVSRDLVGFGIPSSVDEIFEDDDHSMTLVFSHRLLRNQQVSFEFDWPRSLVDKNRKCRGKARLTLVSSPPLNADFGAEFVRVNIEAALQQRVAKGKPNQWVGQLDPVYLPGKSDPLIEAERIKYGFKWSPTKMLERNMHGVGSSQNWKLSIKYLSRTDDSEIPFDGVPFTAILTISDPNRVAPVFSQMRSRLIELGVEIDDIRTAARVGAIG